MQKGDTDTSDVVASTPETQATEPVTLAQRNCSRLTTYCTHPPLKVLP